MILMLSIIYFNQHGQCVVLLEATSPGGRYSSQKPPITCKLAVMLGFHVRIYLSIYIYIYVYLSSYLTIYLSICLSVYLSVCLPVYLSICMSVCPIKFNLIQPNLIYLAVPLSLSQSISTYHI